MRKKQENKGKGTVLKLIIFGSIIIMLLISFCSFFIHWYEDLSLVDNLRQRHLEERNALGQLGVFLSYVFIYKGVGIAAFIPLYMLISDFFRLATGRKISVNRWGVATCWTLFISVFLGFLEGDGSVFSGAVGYEINSLMRDYAGYFGTYLLLIVLLSVYFVFKFDITVDSFKAFVCSVREGMKRSSEFFGKIKVYFSNKVEDIKNKIKEERKENEYEDEAEEQEENEEIEAEEEDEQDKNVFIENKNLPPMKVNILNEEEAKEEKVKVTAEDLVEKYGEYDHRKELAGYIFPSMDLLTVNNEALVMDKDELQENQEKIVKTLKNFDIEIKSISATIGPTFTLYEIIPADGVRVSKIRNLEVDIALSLAAIGIRIIAPIPGKGTIGIEIPNKKPSLVSIRSVLSSNKFQTSNMELPIAFGKTITNETFVVDLAKMPHLLMAGATGQGKSVGLNVMLTSLLYKKHPSEVKFVLVDPKKVELTLYKKIERYYLAKLPDSDSAIITDNSKVINTLNSLCIEMDDRYTLLEKAGAKNLKEYNGKFSKRVLNPEEGHKYLPYIVLVIDEFADLIMTAGKEIELPIARLAQLARAVGIHLIVATQRPTVNVITGLIKANFPARVAFKVTQSNDSKTILDEPGADKLVGKGDMLFTQGNELTRIQCAFIDTNEVEHVVNSIDNNSCVSEPYILPESEGEGGIPEKVDVSKIDPKFKESAYIVVTTQRGSVSDIQRKLEIGFNRAGRIMDQLEAHGIVGPNRGSKPREVMYQDVFLLEEALKEKGIE